MQWLHFLLFLVLPFCLVFSFFHDIATLTIPNWVSILLASVFLPVALIARVDIVDIALHYGVGVLALGFGVVAFAVRLMGGGDAKLIAALAVWLGWQLVLPFLLIMAIAGGALALAILVGRRVNRDRPAPARPLIAPGILANGNIPYGVAIAVGGLYLMQDMAVFPRAAFDALF